MVTQATGLASRIVLNDGVEMPLFGLGMYLSSSGPGQAAERAVIHAVKNNYRLIDTAQFYGNEADVGRGVKNCGVDRKDLFIVTKLWTNGAESCRKSFSESLKLLDTGYIDLYLIHSPSNGSGKVIETYKVMLELKGQDLLRSVGVSNFGVHHLEGLKKAGLPAPSVNQIELHPWQQKKDIVAYCRENNITVMGYCPLTRNQKLDHTTLKKIADEYSKSPAQILIRWSVQNGYITIPKSSDEGRILENTQVFDWNLKEEDMKILNSMPDDSCTWNPCVSPWQG